jgi:hypothetical protein
MLDMSKFNSLFGSAPEPPEPPKPTPEQLPEGLKQVQISIDADKWAANQAAAIHKQYQENISKASARMAVIIKGTKEGESKHTLFLQALEVIDILVNDGGTFIKTVKKNMDFVADEAIEAAHAAGYDYITDPKRSELAAIRARLQRLTAAERTAAGDDKARIQHAIERHREQEKQLVKVLEINQNSA